MSLNPTDAKWRTRVRTRDGRTATLLYVPTPGKRHGTKARVVLDSGAFLSVPVDELELDR